MSYEQLIYLIYDIRIGVCFFCANILLLRSKDRGVYVPLALFFLSLAVSDLPDAIIRHQESSSELLAAHYLNILLVPITLSSPFLFWAYVQALTAETMPSNITNKLYHFIPVAVISLFMIPVLFIPPDLIVAASQAEIDVSDNILILFIIAYFGIGLGELLFNALCAFYFYLIFMQLRVHRARLRDIFASTETRELKWVWLIILCTAVYICFSTLDTLLSNFDLYPELSDSDPFILIIELLLLAVVWVIGLWGLRQRPIFLNAPVAEPSDPPKKKYEKSALDDERVKRIAVKIKAAMENDRLYRDANLSLWDLSKHIGVAYHYVSQTLNSELGSSFFDYVNSWRIKDAIKQLETTDEAILVIAYDVGFNSRSSFYKAFKNETGKKPSDLRK